MEIQGKVAIVTGAAQGIGKGYATALLDRGAKIVITDKSQEVGSRTEQELQTQYGADNVKFIRGDVTSDEDMKEVFDTAVRDMGGLHIVINNAGIGESLGLHKCYEVNTFGIMRCTELALERMLKENGGQGGVIVNISSIAALRALPLGQIYGPSKIAVVGYSRSLARRLGDNSEVRVGILCPGFVLTELTAGMKAAEEKKTPVPMQQLSIAGGWTEMSTVVEAAMAIIEKDLPQGAVIRALADGVVMVKLEEAPVESIL